jgi:predicted transcriptional regulator
MTMSIEVPPELEARLREQAQQRGQELAEYVRAALEALVARAVTPQDEGSGGEASVIGLFEAAWSRLPETERAALPTDLAEHHDHYAYGTPKPRG